MRTLTYHQAGNLERYGRNYLELCSTPTAEKCTQAGADAKSNKLECQALKDQLERQHGAAPETAEFFVMRNEHEFGTYYELAIAYHEPVEPSETDGDGAEYAGRIEAGIPENWDAAAMEFLAANDYGLFARVVPMFRKTA